MPITRPLVFVIIAIVCFAIGLLLALGALAGGNLMAWLFGGLLALACAQLP